MKTHTLISLLLSVSLFTTVSFAQTPAPANGEPRITFMLKNTLGYNRMFLVEGPGIAYGFSMNKRQTIPCNWPVGSKLHFTKDGKTSSGLILTVTAVDEGKTLTTDTGAAEVVSALAQISTRKVSFKLRNPSLLPKKITLVSYTPGETGNGTTGFMLAPRGTKSFAFVAGTRLYLATSEQVDVVMSGRRIDSGKPFLTVKTEDANKAFDVN